MHFNIRIYIDKFGNKISSEDAFARTICRFVPFEILSFLSPVGWHEEWTDTFVVSIKEYKEIRSIIEGKEEEIKPEEKENQYLFPYKLPAILLPYFYKVNSRTKS